MGVVPARSSCTLLALSHGCAVNQSPLRGRRNGPRGGWHNGADRVPGLVRGVAFWSGATLIVGVGLRVLIHKFACGCIDVGIGPNVTCRSRGSGSIADTEGPSSLAVINCHDLSTLLNWCLPILASVCLVANEGQGWRDCAV